jgi:hypothetical protein
MLRMVSRFICRYLLFRYESLFLRIFFFIFIEQLILVSLVIARFIFVCPGAIYFRILAFRTRVTAMRCWHLDFLSSSHEFSDFYSRNIGPSNSISKYRQFSELYSPEKNTQFR